MADVRQLAELYQRVVQDELGLVARIEDDGDVLFTHPEFGEFFISLNAERDPEFMRMMLPAFFSANQGVSKQDLIEICNRINAKARLTILSVYDDEHGSVVASVGLVLAAPDAVPNEQLLRGVIGRAMSSMKSALEKFGQAVDERMALGEKADSDRGRVPSREELLALIGAWEKTNDELTDQIATFQNPASKDLARAVQCQGQKMTLQKCILTLYELINAEAT